MLTKLLESGLRRLPPKRRAPLVKPHRPSNEESSLKSNCLTPQLCGIQWLLYDLTVGLAKEGAKSTRRLPHGFLGCQTIPTVETQSQTVNFSTKWIRTRFTRQTCIGCKNRNHGCHGLISTIRALIPYTAESDRFRNKIAKCLKEQLLTHFDPRNSRMERCLPLAPTRACSPCVRIKI